MNQYSVSQQKINSPTSTMSISKTQELTLKGQVTGSYPFTNKPSNNKYGNAPINAFKETTSGYLSPSLHGPPYQTYFNPTLKTNKCSSDVFGDNYSRKERIKAPEGLPNLGNTCFLNSSLQLLYGVEKLRNFLKKKFLSKKIPEDKESVLYQLSLLFYNLEFGHFEDDEQKRKLLNFIVLDIEKRNLGYLRKYQNQQDVLEVINTIIDAVDAQLPEKQQMKHYFSFTTLRKCKCAKEGLTVDSIFFKNTNKQYCFTCFEVITTQILRLSEYLLVFSSEDQEYMRINDDSYEFVSKIMYFGSGYSGHYFCVRKQSDLYYQLDDIHVREIKKDDYRSSKIYKIRLLLYKKQSKCPETIHS